MEVAVSNTRTSRKLGALLRKHGLNRAFVAEGLFVSEDTIDNWCTGRSALRPHMLSALAQFLRDNGVPAEELGEIIREEALAAGLDLNIIAEYALRPPGVWRDVVALLISEPRYISQTIMQSGVWEEMAAAKRLQIVTLCDWASKEQLTANLRQVKEQRPAAIVFITQTEMTDEIRSMRASLVKDGMKVIACGPTAWPGETSIVMNERHMVKLAVEQLLSLGHRKIGALFVQDYPTQDERYKGFLDALSSHGISPEDCPIRWAPLKSSERVIAQAPEQIALTRVATYFAQREDITALVSPSDTATASLLTALNDEGRRCPDDVSLIGIKTTSWVDALLLPPLTHISPPYFQAGKLAGRAVLEALGAASPLEAKSQRVTELNDYVITARTGGTIGRPRARTHLASRGA